MNKYSEYFVALLYAIPGAVFAFSQPTDIFGKIAIFVIAYIVTALSGSALAAFMKLAEASEKLGDKAKRQGFYILCIWFGIVVLAFIFGGTSYLGASFYGGVVGWLDRKFIRPAKFDKMVTNTLADD